MSSPTATAYAISADDTGVEIAANPLRASISFSVPSNTDDPVFVCFTELGDADAAEGFTVVPGAAPFTFNGYIGVLSVICATSGTADLRVAEINL